MRERIMSPAREDEVSPRKRLNVWKDTHNAAESGDAEGGSNVCSETRVEVTTACCARDGTLQIMWTSGFAIENKLHSPSHAKRVNVPRVPYTGGGESPVLG